MSLVPRSKVVSEWPIGNTIGDRHLLDTLFKTFILKMWDTRDGLNAASIESFKNIMLCNLFGAVFELVTAD